jgi:hypothetical protein
MKNRKLILMSGAIALAAASLAVGGTFALFTKTESVQVNVKSAQISLGLSIDAASLKTYSMDVAQTAGVFANGGTAAVNGTAIDLNNMAPGDKVEFNVKFTNASTIATKYVFSAAVKGELSGILNVTESTPVTDWTNLAVGGTVADETITIEMPTTADVTVANKESVVYATAKVMQQNADVSDLIVNASQLKTFLQTGGSATLANNIKIGDSDIANGSFATVPTGKEADLDLNGYCINAVDKTNEIQALFTNDGTLDITDNSVNYDGVISLNTKEDATWATRQTIINNLGTFSMSGGYLYNFTGTVDSDGNASTLSMCIDQNVVSAAASTEIALTGLKTPYCGIRIFGGGETAALTSSLTLDYGTTVEGGQRGIWLQNTGDWTAKPTQFESLTMVNTWASYGYAAPYVYGQQIGVYAANFSDTATFTMTLTAGTIENAYAWSDNAYQAALSYNINGTAVTKGAGLTLKTITGGAKEIHSDHSSGSYVNTKIA